MEKIVYSIYYNQDDRAIAHTRDANYIVYSLSHFSFALTMEQFDWNYI